MFKQTFETNTFYINWSHNHQTPNSWITMNSLHGHTFWTQCQCWTSKVSPLYHELPRKNMEKYPLLFYLKKGCELWKKSLKFDCRSLFSSFPSTSDFFLAQDWSTGRKPCQSWIYNDFHVSENRGYPQITIWIKKMMVIHWNWHATHIPSYIYIYSII